MERILMTAIAKRPPMMAVGSKLFSVSTKLGMMASTMGALLVKAMRSANARLFSLMMRALYVETSLMLLWIAHSHA
jgi:hypothetical protein